MSRNGNGRRAAGNALATLEPAGNPEGRYAVTATLVGQFWRAAQGGPEDAANAWAIVERVKADMLLEPELAGLYRVLTHRFAANESLEPAMVLRALPEGVTPNAVQHAELAGAQRVKVSELCTAVVQEYQASTLGQLCMAAGHHLGEGKGRADGGKRLGEALALRIMALFHQDAGAGGLLTREQVINAARERHLSDRPRGIHWPFPKLERALLGPTVPGDVNGWAGFSGTGKTTWITNMVRGFAQQVPCIVFPTESRQQFLDRMAVQVAGELAVQRGHAVSVEQWRAEKMIWAGAHDQRELFLEALELLKGLNFYLVDRANISPAEILLTVRILRQQHPDEVCMAFVDHMHRLRYDDGEEADDAAGRYTKDMKNQAGDDPVGLVWHLLYQPRKPGMNDHRYRPVEPHEIRGHSSIWNELDVYLSPFRTYVKTDTGLIPNWWGTPRTRRDANGKPVPGKRSEVDDGEAKLDDENAYLWVGKRRIGGDLSKPLWLRYHPVSTQIWEDPSVPDVNE